MEKPNLIRIYESVPKVVNDEFILFSSLRIGQKILGFQKDFKAVDIRTVDDVWRPDFDMIDYYLINF